TATLLPSVVAELGGVNLISWPTTAFVASSIIAARREPCQRQVWKPLGILGGRHHLRGRCPVVCLCAFDRVRDRRTLRAGTGRRPALGSCLCACAQCISRTSLAQSLWPARGRLVGHRADWTSDRRRIRKLRALAHRVCYGRGGWMLAPYKRA